MVKRKTERIVCEREINRFSVLVRKERDEFSSEELR